MTGTIVQLGALLRQLMARRGSITPGPEGAAWTYQQVRARLDALLSARSEPAAVLLGKPLLEGLIQDETARAAFFAILATDFDPDPDAVVASAAAYAESRSIDALRALTRSSEPARQTILRRLNLVPGGTAALVRLRAELLDALTGSPDLAKLDDDLLHLFQSWFNTGFLVLRRIDWSTPARTLEKIIAYEAVHQIRGWDDLRRRLEPADRLCFAFFHPAMPDEPLIFVEVALCRSVASSVDAILAADRVAMDAALCDTAIFYSISNCQRGLSGVSFGNVLIKMVAKSIAASHPSVRRFATLSPLPGFRKWFDAQAAARQGTTAGPDQTALMAAAARYLVAERRSDQQPIDPVARFHLGNGALLYRLNWAADSSAKGIAQSFGIMANYVYELAKVDAREAEYAGSRRISIDPQVSNMHVADARPWVRRLARA